MQDSSDVMYMERCLQLAQKGEYTVAPNPMVGAVLVRTTIGRDGYTHNEIIGEGWHRKYGEGHAEVNCFADAERRGYTYFGDCTLYVSLEPCSHYGKTPPCALLLVSKGVKKVVIGMKDPNPLVSGKGIKILEDAGVEVIVGVLETACRLLNKRFLCLQEKGRPYIILKWAQTADGFIDIKRDITDINSIGRQIVISNSVSKQLVHKMRAENMAIMVGTRTALMDNPSLRVTRWSGRNPVRILLDRKGIVPGHYKIFSDDAETIVYKDNTDFSHILSDLAKRNIHSVLVEGGSILLTHILESGLWDEAHIEITETTITDGIKAPVIPLQNLIYERTIGNSRLYRIDRHFCDLTKM